MMTNATTLSSQLRAHAEGTPAWQELCDSFVARKRALGAGSGAPKVGEPFPTLSLPDLHGRQRSLSSLYAEGPIVLSFKRGDWCPYCKIELESWHQAIPDLAKAGGRLVVVAGLVGGRSTALSRLLGDRAAILCDVDHGAALTLGLAIHAGFDVIDRYRQNGLDLASLYGTASGFLPIPATFVIDQQGIIRFAFVNPDFRVRAEPADVLAVVRSITGHA